MAAERAKYAVEMEPALFERSVRFALALESVTKEQGFDAFTAFDQVWLTDPRVGIIPSYGTGRLCEIGIPAAPEGDVNTAVAQLILQELAGQATTLENYVVDYDSQAVMFSHDGHGNPALGTPGAVKVKHSIYYTGVHGFGAGFEYAYEPGPITNLALVTTGYGQWRFVISEGELLPFPPRSISAPQTLFKHDTLRHRRLVRRVAPGRRDPPHGRRAGAAGRRSSCTSPGCSASKRWSSDRGHRAADPAAGLRDRPQGLQLGRRGGPARRRGRPPGRAPRRERRVQRPGRGHPGDRGRHAATSWSSPSTWTRCRRAAAWAGSWPRRCATAGAVGTLLNHSEKRMTLGDIAPAVVRARETGLGTLVFADSPAEAAALAQLGPDIILAEPPELIATGRSAGAVMAEFVEETVAAVRAIDPAILVMSGAGVNTPADVAGMIRLGLDGTGSSSGILKADDPVRVMREMLEALAGAWEERHR